MTADAARIVLVGAESTGKTTLAQDLVDHYRALGGTYELTRWVPEYGREYTEILLARQDVVAADGEAGSAEWTAEDFAVIAREQQKLEDAAAASGAPLLIADTDALATQVWERRYLGEESSAARDAVPVLPPRALYLLTDWRDVPFEQDGIRDGEHLREQMTQWFVEELEKRGEPWALISGDRQERLERSIRLIDEALTYR